MSQSNQICLKRSCIFFNVKSDHKANPFLGKMDYVRKRCDSFSKQNKENFVHGNLYGEVFSIFDRKRPDNGYLKGQRIPKCRKQPCFPFVTPCFSYFPGNIFLVPIEKIYTF